MKFFFAGVAVLAAQLALAYGPWLEKTPIGGVELSEGWSREEFEKGGQCLHLNCFDSSVLRDAWKHPERYPDLQVRVCGWNVLWRNLSRAEQDRFIATAEAQE